MESTVRRSRLSFSPRLVTLCVAIASALTVGTLSTPSTASAQDTVVVGRHRHEIRPRVRFGLSGVGGGFVGPVYGGAAGLAPRIGVQFNDLFAAYVQAHLMLGQFEPDRPDSRFAGFAFHEAIFEVTIADMFQLGGGPSIDVYWGCDSNANGVATCGRSDARFGADFRAAIVVGGRHDGPGHRSGLTFSIDAHPTWLDPSFAGMFLFGVGGELY